MTRRVLLPFAVSIALLAAPPALSQEPTDSPSPTTSPTTSPPPTESPSPTDSPSPGDSPDPSPSPTNDGGSGEDPSPTPVPSPTGDGIVILGPGQVGDDPSATQDPFSPQPELSPAPAPAQEAPAQDPVAPTRVETGGGWLARQEQRGVALPAVALAGATLLLLAGLARRRRGAR